MPDPVSIESRLSVLEEAVRKLSEEELAALDKRVEALERERANSQY